MSGFVRLHVTKKLGSAGGGGGSERQRVNGWRVGREAKVVLEELARLAVLGELAEVACFRFEPMKTSVARYDGLMFGSELGEATFRCACACACVCAWACDMCLRT